MTKARLIELLQYAFDMYGGYVPSDRQLELLIEDFINEQRTELIPRGASTSQLLSEAGQFNRAKVRRSSRPNLRRGDHERHY